MTDQKKLSDELILKICKLGQLQKMASYNDTIFCNLCSTKKLKTCITYETYNICITCQKKTIQSNSKKNQWKKPKFIKKQINIIPDASDTYIINKESLIFLGYYCRSYGCCPTWCNICHKCY